MVNKTMIYDGKEIVPAETKGLPYDNRGVLFGETVFTTLRTFEGKPLFLSDHFERLQKGLKYFFEDINYDWEKIEKKILKGIFKLRKELVTEKKDIYLRVTIYPKTQRNIELSKRPEKMGFFIMAKQIGYGIPKAKEVKVTVAKKRLYERYLPNYVKVGTYLETARELRIAYDKNFDDVLFLNRDDFLAEGATSNLFFRKGERIFTPDIKTGILEGITRNHLIDCLRSSGITVDEGFYKYDELKDADEAWLSSSVKGIRPMICIENKKFISYQSMDSWTDRIIGSFEKYCKNYEE